VKAHVLTVFSLILLFAISTTAQASPPDDGLTARQIVDKVLAKDNVFGMGQARLKLTIQNSKGQERVRAVETRSITVDDLRWTLVTFVEPADVAGTRLLAKEAKDGDDLQYLYLPALKEKRRIAGSEKNESFMGTDFTYNDLEQKGMEEGDHTRLADEQHSGIDCFRIDAVPKDKDDEYSKLELWIDKKDFLPLKIYFYDRKGAHLKTLVAQKVETLQGEVTVTKLMMKNVKKGTKTTMVLETLDRKKSFPKAMFDENALDK